MTRIEMISKLLLDEVADRFDKDTLHALRDVEFGDSFAELLDRFLVLHIRMWKLEDTIAETKDVFKVTELKRKLDTCFKDKRPKLTKAINTFLDVYISKNHARAFTDENVKLYKGY